MEDKLIINKKNLKQGVKRHPVFVKKVVKTTDFVSQLC